MKITEEELENLLNNMELEVPSMSFTRNVMNQVELEVQPVALKTKVDRRIIYSIAAVFVMAISILLIYVFTQAQLRLEWPHMNFRLKISVDLDQESKLMFFKSFLLVDLILVLIYLDRLVRRKMKIS